MQIKIFRIEQLSVFQWLEILFIYYILMRSVAMVSFLQVLCTEWLMFHFLEQNNTLQIMWACHQYGSSVLHSLLSLCNEQFNLTLIPALLWLVSPYHWLSLGGGGHRHIHANDIRIWVRLKQMLLRCLRLAALHTSFNVKFCPLNEWGLVHPP